MIGFSISFVGQSVGASRVCLPFLQMSPDGRAQARIRVWDDTNDAEIASFDGPKYIGTHDGAGNSATLIDSTARWPQSMVGAKLYNVTDSSSTTVTAVSGDGTTLTGVLAGGVDNDWDASDEYRIVWDVPWAESFCYSLPTIVGGAAADCTAYTIYIFNQGAGEIFMDQIEIYSNRLPNGSFATGAGDPWIPEDWTNNDFGVGQSSQETSLVHSGGSCIKFNGSVSGQRQMQKSSVVTGGGTYSMFGCWRYGTTSVLGPVYISNASPQTSNPGNYANEHQTAGDVWENLERVIRVDLGVAREVRMLDGTTTGNRYADDYYLVQLDAVSCTVTPTTEANSLEESGIRVDGNDILTRLLDTVTVSEGSLKFKVTPRVDYAEDAFSNGSVPFLFFLQDNPTDRIYIQKTGATTMRLTHQSGVGGFTNADWTPVTLNSGVEYQFQINYQTGGNLELLVDDVVVASAGPIPNDLAGLPAEVYLGMDANGNSQFGAVIS